MYGATKCAPRRTLFRVTIDCFPLPADELQAAIDRAEAKRRDLQDQQLGSTAPMSKALALMPRAAEIYRRQVALGLDGNPQVAQKARLFLREWFGGKIRLEPLADGGSMAHWNQNIGALVSAGVGTYGSGGSIRSWKSLKTKEIQVR